MKIKGEKRVKLLDLSTPLELIGRPAQFQRIVQVLAQDGDLLIAGVPGCGRRTLVRRAVEEVGAIALEVDCIRATDGERFVQLLCETISLFFRSTATQALIEQWIASTTAKSFFVYDVEESGRKLRLLRSVKSQQLSQAFEVLLELPQFLGESLSKQVVLILHSFPHIRSWDRNRSWETFLRREIQHHSQVSYVLIATIAETSTPADEAIAPVETVQLTPLSDEFLAVWAREILHSEELTFDSRSQALELFLDAVQGHFGDAMTLIRRLKTMRQPDGIIRYSQVQEAIQGLLKDLSITFESLLMLLPANQVHLLESLALDPTEKPQSREYINKHGLSRGGSLQGALSGLQHKGLIYGSEQGYRLALPLLALWIRQRLI
ncbi:MAG TPA: ATP-binding protein [Cyanobacteria bacterium UBA8543]|nr:ATP-binding protein [Cyanobacteria bacterium UBA8543]